MIRKLLFAILAICSAQRVISAQEFDYSSIGSTYNITRSLVITGNELYKVNPELAKKLTQFCLEGAKLYKSLYEEILIQKDFPNIKEEFFSYTISKYEALTKKYKNDFEEFGKITYKDFNKPSILNFKTSLFSFLQEEISTHFESTYLPLRHYKRFTSVEEIKKAKELTEKSINSLEYQIEKIELWLKEKQ